MIFPYTFQIYLRLILCVFHRLSDLALARLTQQPKAIHSLYGCRCLLQRVCARLSLRSDFIFLVFNFAGVAVFFIRFLSRMLTFIPSTSSENSMLIFAPLTVCKCILAHLRRLNLRRFPCVSWIRLWFGVGFVKYVHSTSTTLDQQSARYASARKPINLSSSPADVCVPANRQYSWTVYIYVCDA